MYSSTLPSQFQHILATWERTDVIVCPFKWNAYTEQIRFLKQLVSKFLSLSVAFNICSLLLKTINTVLFFVTGSVTVGSLYYAEILPAKYLYMGPLIGSLVAGSTLGDGLVVLVGYFLLADNAYSWQFYLIAMSTPMVLFLILALFFLEETPQFYLAKGNETKAKKILQKWAAQNGKQIPDNIKLLAPKLNQTSTFNAIHLRKIRDVYSHLHFTKNWICIVLIAGMSRSLNDGMNFTLAELLYAKGESGYYCKGSETKTYYLTKSDYTALLLAQLVSVVTFLIAYPIMRAGISAKIRALSCFALSIPLVSGLYLCPNSAVAFVLLSVVRICAQISTLAAVHALVELMIPSDVRGTIIGVSNSIRTAPLALYALLTTTLAKHSQNYVTSLTMAVLLIGLAAALVMSNDVNKNIRPKEREHASLDELVEISENSNI